MMRGPEISPLGGDPVRRACPRPAARVVDSHAGGNNEDALMVGRASLGCSCRSPVGPGALISDSFTWGSEATPVLLRLCSLIALRASLYRPPPQAVRATSALSTGGMSSSARAPQDEGCTPVPAAVCRALRGAAHQSLHGFADGSSGCQGAGSFPALFVWLCLHPPCCSAQRSVASAPSSCWHVSGFRQGAGDNGIDRVPPRTGDRSCLLPGFLPKP